MSDGPYFYCDDHQVRDLEYIWQHAGSLLFSNSDFHSRSFPRVHRVVRRVLSDVLMEEIHEVHYAYAPSAKVRARLDVQGYTRERCRELWVREHAQQVARLSQLYDSGQLTERGKIDALRVQTFEQWLEGQQRVPRSYRRLYDVEVRDALAALALEIDARRPTAIWADFSDVFDQFDQALSFHDNLDREPQDVDFIETTGQVLILTEGASDTRILSAAIEAMYPEYADFYEFVDFEEFKIEGGASPLTKMVRAFAGVSMTQRILAIFDNDAAGIEQQALLQRMRLPSSVRTMVLPDCSVARRYPALGPGGLQSLDVNGSACSIELFLGRDALSLPDGSLRPVRWSSWNRIAQRYQGELEDKRSATEAFIGMMRVGRTPSQLRKAFPDMDRLLKSIFTAFIDVERRR